MMSRTVRSTDRSMPSFVARAANRTPTPRAIPPIVRRLRARRAQRLRQASRESPRIALLEPDLGEPGDQRCCVVRLAPAERNLLEDPAVADDAHPIGVRGR